MSSEEKLKELIPVYDLRDQVAPVPIPKPKPNPRCYTTISVLNPAVRVERTAKSKNGEDYYRISASFDLQPEIIGFDQEYVIKDSP